MLFRSGETIEVLQRSPDRIEPRCPHFGVCAGCVLQHLDQDKQIGAKQHVLEENLTRIGHVTPARMLSPLIDKAWGYRRKGRFSVRYVEKKLEREEHQLKKDAIGVPDIVLMVSDELAVVDNLSGKLHLIVYADPAQPNAHVNATRRLTELRLALRQQAPLPVYVPAGAPDAPKSEIGKEAFLKAVAKCKQYIVDGDIMQVQISQRISQVFDAPPINLYRAVRSINPSPYMFYFDIGDFHIIEIGRAHV